MGLRSKLFLSYFLLIGIALVSFGYIAVKNSTEILLEEIKGTLNSIVELKVSQVKDYVDEKERITELYASLPIISKAVTAFSGAFLDGVSSPNYQENLAVYTYILAKFGSDSHSTDLFLIAPNGDVVFSVEGEAETFTNLRTGPFKKTLLAFSFERATKYHSGKVTNFEPFIPLASANQDNQAHQAHQDQHQLKRYAFVASPIIANGQLVGVLALKLSSNDYFHLSEDYSWLGATGEVVLGKKKGSLVSIISPLRNKPNAAFNLSYEMGSRFAIPLQKAVSGEDGSGEMFDYVGKPIIASWRYIKETEWGVVVKIDTSEALERASQLQQELVTWALILLIISGLLVLILANKITSPLNALLSYIIDVGNRTVETDLKVIGNDEVGRLTEAFNQMTRKRQSYEKELEVTSDSVIQANKELINANHIANEAVRAKGEFFASMSHEIRTPMNGVLGMLGLLENTELTKEQKHRVSVAQSSAESLLTLINDILDYSKVDAGKIDLEYLNFDVRKMFDDIAESLAHMAQSKDLELILDLRGIDASRVKGDPGRIRQCVTNLVSNAIKFTDKGEVKISVHLTSIDDNHWNMNCAVNDSGIGIPEDKLKFLFDSFSQVDASTTRRFGGTGLGLAIVKKLAELMGGNVLVTSEIGKGSSFSFNIKLEKSSQSETVMPRMDISELNILVVDDNETNREILREQLTHWGASVVECESGDETLTHLDDLLEHKKAIYDIAILDMQMPNMDGAELGKTIRMNQALKEMKLVMMTSMGHQGDAKFFADLGFNAYFPKPTTTEDLFHALSVMAENGEAMENAEPLVTHRYLNELQIESDENEAIDLGSKRILLVEDNQVNQMVAKGILKKIGCVSIDIAADGIEALESLQRAPEDAPYDLVLMDCQMPEMDGYEATRQIRAGKGGERNKVIPIVAMTANAMQGDKDKCIKSGMDDYLSKPIDIVGLKLKLIEYLG